MFQPFSFLTKNYQPVILRALDMTDLGRLADYLQHLSDETKKRFGPHHFDSASITDFYNRPNENTGFIAQEIDSNRIIAYAIIRAGYLPHDKQRLESYGLNADNMKCCTYAPSVSDEWQSLGIGKAMLGYILKELSITGIYHIILWGGVQSSNEKAVNFYKKADFNTLGQFEYFGLNYDMMLTLNA